MINRITGKKSILGFAGMLSKEEAKDNAAIKKAAELENKNIFDFESSVHAADIHRSLVSEGLFIEPEDSMIAGICLRHDETIITRNVKHFEKVKGLKIERY